MLNKNLIPTSVFNFVKDYNIQHPTIEDIKKWWAEMGTVVNNFPFPDEEMRNHFMKERHLPLAEEIEKLSPDSKTPICDLISFGTYLETYIGDLLRDHFEFYDSKEYHNALDEELAKRRIMTHSEIDEAYDEIMKRISAPEVVTDGLLQFFLKHPSIRLANRRRAAKEDVSIARGQLNQFVRSIISMRRTLDTPRDVLKNRYNSLQERRGLFTSPTDEETFRKEGMARTLNKIRILPELQLELLRCEHPNLAEAELKDRLNRMEYNPKTLVKMQEVLLSETSTEEEKEDIHRKIYSYHSNTVIKMKHVNAQPKREECDTEARRLFQMTRENLHRINGIVRERLSTVENREVYEYINRIAGNVDQMARIQIISLRNSQFEWSMVESFILATNFLLSFSDEEILAQLKKTQYNSK